MKTRLLVLISLIFSVIFGCSVASAEDAGKRIALVIGNAKYPDADSPLKEPIADTRAMADELKRSGFEVAQGENLGREAMQKAIDNLYGRIKPGSVVMVFFSGFGIQSGRQTFLIPVDGQLWTEADVRRDGFSLDNMLGEINSRGAGVKIAILDASRRNPFERRFRSYSAGLAPATAPQGSLVMYSAAPGSVVPDATSDHSLFVNELLKEIRVPGLTADEALNRTRKGVSLASQGDQVPWFSSSLAEEFSFGPGPVDSASTSTSQTSNQIPPAQPPDSKVASLDPPPAVKPTVSAPTIPDLPKPNTATPAPTVANTTPTPALPQVTTPQVATPQVATPQVTTPQVTPPQVTAPQVTTPQVSTPVPSSQPVQQQDPKLAALQNDPAIRDQTQLISNNPSDENAYYKRGQIYASKGAYGAALNDFDQAIMLNPRDFEALNNRCWVRTIVGELQSALKDCNDALGLRPNFAEALDSRGLVNLKLGQNTGALNDFDAALRLKPSLASSLYGRGIARKRTGLAAAGDRDIQAAKQISPDVANDFASYGIR
jgi:Caspase domain/Tetratricopeptide repeat